MEMLENEIARSQKYDLSFAMIVVCMDNLMEIVTQNGYKTGNAIVMNIMNLLGNHIREKDFLCRLDRDSFCLVLPRTTEKEGTKSLRRYARFFPLILFRRFPTALRAA